MKNFNEIVMNIIEKSDLLSGLYVYGYTLNCRTGADRDDLFDLVKNLTNEIVDNSRFADWWSDKHRCITRILTFPAVMIFCMYSSLKTTKAIGNYYRFKKEVLTK